MKFNHADRWLLMDFIFNGVTTNTFQVTDVAGNSTICSFTISVADVEAPIALCQNITSYLNNAGTSINASDPDQQRLEGCMREKRH